MMQETPSHWAEVWAAACECGREDRLLRARLRWAAQLLRQHRAALSPGAWLLSDERAGPGLSRVACQPGPSFAGSTADCAIPLPGTHEEPPSFRIDVGPDGDVALQPLENAAVRVNGDPVPTRGVSLHSGEVIESRSVRCCFVWIGSLTSVS